MTQPEMLGPVPVAEFMCDGCSWSPDWLPLSRVSLTPACRYHDWHYTIGGNAAARRLADLTFWRNLRRCGAPRRIALYYWLAVRLFGRSAFNWHEARK